MFPSPPPYGAVWNMNVRLVLITAALVLATLAVAPAAEARPQCLQVYPWSELCEGDVGSFVCHYAYPTDPTLRGILCGLGAR